MTPSKDSDIRYMQKALALAERSVGQTAPNPAVGCVIVKEDEIIGRGATAKGGRPHAEKIALAEAGERAKAATAYVTLEPCCFEGKSGACTDQLIAAGIQRIVIAIKDPHAEVSGKGITILQKAGLEIAVGICEKEARIINEGFFLAQEQQRPLVTVKLATSHDHKIARLPGQPQWITGEEARMHGHGLRYQHDAILVGSQTVLDDNPQLTCRLSGAEDKSLIRIILDGRNRITDEAKIIQTAADHPTWVVGKTNRQWTYVNHMECNPHNIQELLAKLAQEGITRLLVEGGAEVITSFMQSGCVDQCYWYIAPGEIGEGGKEIDITSLISATPLQLIATQLIGDDTLSVYVRPELSII